ncbi:putative ribonuclease H-like domain-containing protein [Tanacetum coccineum]
MFWNWTIMFDLDFLTNSMNYIPVSVENQVNVDAGTQDSYVAGSSGKDKGPTQEYILLPLQPHRTRILVEDVAPAAHEKPSESSPKDNDVQDSEDVKEWQHQMTEDEQLYEEEKRNIASQKRAAQATSTNKLSTVRSYLSTATTPYVSAASTPTEDPEQITSLNKIKVRVGSNARGIATFQIIEVFWVTCLYLHMGKKALLICSTKQSQKVIKALYGLHQAPRAWYETLSSFLMKNGFRRGTIDNTLFIKKKKSDIISKENHFLWTSSEATTLNGIFNSQDKYVDDILKKFDFCSIRIVTTPIESNNPLVKDEDGVDVDVHVYRLSVPKMPSHLNAEKDFRHLKQQPKLEYVAAANCCVASIMDIELDDGIMDLLTKDEGEASERQSEPQPTPSPPYPSADQYQTQPDPSPRPSPTILDSILEGSGGNHGGQSSSDKSLSRNEDGLTLQSVYDLCVSLCKQEPAKAKPTVHKDPAFEDLDDIMDDAIDYMESEDAQDEGRTSSVVLEEKESTDKSKVSTDKPEVSTELTKEVEVSTDKLDEGTAEPKDGTSDESTAPTTVFRDDETIAEFLARIEADRLLAAMLQEEERETFTVEERAKFLYDTIAAKGGSLLNKELYNQEAGPPQELIKETK